MHWRATDLLFDERERGPLKALERCGRGVRIRAREIDIEEGVQIDDGVTLAGDRIHLGAGTRIRNNSDLRATELTIGTRCDVGAGSRVLVAEVFQVGAAGRWDDGAQIVCRRFTAGNLLFLGDDFCVGAGGTMESTAEVTIGHRVALGSHCVFNANLPIVLEDQVGSGDYVTLWTSGFHFGHSILDGYTPAYAPIHVERNVWLAYHVTVLPGTRIGQDTIVAAGSIVTKDLPPRCLAAGVPAQVRRQLEPAAPTPESLASSIGELLETWAGQLAWKGWTTGQPQRSAAGTRFDISSPDGRRGAVTLLASGARPEPVSHGEIQIILSLDDRPDIVPEGPTSAIFELRSRAYRGASFDVAEDLRDFLRRRTIPCGDDRLFQSIVPTPFDYLRKLL